MDTAAKPWVPVFVLAIALALPAIAATDGNWPEFRGPAGDGTSPGANAPLHWSEQENVAWRTEIHGKGWSSPVVWGAQVWLTTATEDGKKLFVLCVERENGKIIHDLEIFNVEKPQYCHPVNSYASPTPTVEEGRIYVTFGSAGTACLETATGKVLWERRDLECNHFRGAGSSPILHGDLLFLNYDGSDQQYVVAFEKKSGRTAWRTKRSVDFRDLDLFGKAEGDGDFRKAFGTCTVAMLGGVETLVSQGSKAVYGYEPRSGRELWRVEELSNYSGSTRPLVWEGLVFVPSGFPSGVLLAIRPGANGEVLDAKGTNPPGSKLEVVWKTKVAVPKKPSLLVAGGLLYSVEDNGTATCREPATGEVVWSQSLGGHYSASPLAVAGRIYFFSEEGKATVVAQGREFRQLAENKLGNGFMASPALSEGALFLRSRAMLYRVGG